MFLLSTPILLDLLKKKPAALGLVKEMSEQSRPAISTLSLAELAEKLPKATYQKTWQFLQNFKILPVSDRVAFLAGELISSYTSLKEKLSLNEALMAATALLHGCALLINNPARFSFIKGLELQLYESGNGLLLERKQRAVKNKFVANTGFKHVSTSKKRSVVTR